MLLPEFNRSKYMNATRSLKVTVIFLLLFSWGCDSGMEADSQIVEGVNLEELFAPAQASEIQTVLNDWAGRDVSVQNLTVVETDTVAFASGNRSITRVVSHEVAGVTHFGAIVVPENAAPGSLPAIVYNHGGDQGENIDVTLTLLSFGISSVTDQFVFIVPSYRDEPLTLMGNTYQSEGPASPWDYDVDDALALLNVALETTPAIDPDRIGTFGFSRGGGVALLMAIRDPRIALVSEFFGVTDFFVQDSQDAFTEALQGQPRDLPGLDFLNATYIQPLKNGTLTVDEARIEIIRRSAVVFADQLPDVQIQHGDADNVVVVDHALSLADALQALGRGSDEFELHVYPNAGHNPLEMIGSFDRLVEFMGRLIEMPT